MAITVPYAVTLSPYSSISSSTYSISKPNVLLQGDVIVVVFMNGSSSGDRINGPSGFTRILTQSNVYALFYKKIYNLSTEPYSYVFNMAGSNGGAMMVVRGDNLVVESDGEKYYSTADAYGKKTTEAIAISTLAGGSLANRFTLVSTLGSSYGMQYKVFPASNDIYLPENQGTWHNATGYYHPFLLIVENGKVFGEGESSLGQPNLFNLHGITNIGGGSGFNGASSSFTFKLDKDSMIDAVFLSLYYYTTPKATFKISLKDPTNNLLLAECSARMARDSSSQVATKFPLNKRVLLQANKQYRIEVVAVGLFAQNFNNGQPQRSGVYTDISGTNISGTIVSHTSNTINWVHLAVKPVAKGLPPKKPDSFISDAKASGVYLSGEQIELSWESSTDPQNLNPVTYDLDFFDGTSWINKRTSISTASIKEDMSGIINIKAQYRVRASNSQGIKSEYTFGNIFRLYSSLILIEDDGKLKTIKNGTLNSL